MTETAPPFLMSGREPHLPAYTMVDIPQLEVSKPQDANRNKMIACYRKLLVVRGKCKVYFNRRANSYRLREHQEPQP